MPAAQLSPHFNLGEFVFSDTANLRGINNTPSPSQIEHLTRLASTLEKIRTILGHPIHITSGFRSKELNTAVGGVFDSEHLSGDAADIACYEFGDANAVYEALLPHVTELDLDQLIYEHNGSGVTWVHVGVRAGPRHMAFKMEA